MLSDSTSLTPGLATSVSTEVSAFSVDTAAEEQPTATVEHAANSQVWGWNLLCITFP
jgi:hypothetical protein